MAKCDVCGKKVWFGIQVSHSHRRSNRTWRPNTRRAKICIGGVKKRIKICTGCIKNGKLQKIA